MLANNILKFKNLRRDVCFYLLYIPLLYLWPKFMTLVKNMLGSLILFFVTQFQQQLRNFILNDMVW